MSQFTRSGAAQERLRALVADDDPLFTEVASSALRRFGCAVTVVGDGAAALEALLGRSFDMALIDLSMPHIDGFRLIGLVRSTPRLADLPIMVMTVRDDREAIEEARRLGANWYTTKPVNWAQFRVHMQQVLAGGSGAGEFTLRETRVLASSEPSRLPRAGR